MQMSISYATTRVYCRCQELSIGSIVQSSLCSCLLPCCLWDRLPLKMPLPFEVSTSSNTRFIGPTEFFIPNGISIGSAVFAQLMVGWPFTLQCTPLFPQNCPSLGGSNPHQTHGSLGPPHSASKAASRSV